MSFSGTVKNELCKLETLDPCCYIAELAAVVRTGSAVRKSLTGGWELRIVTENAAFARRIFSTIRKLFGYTPSVSIRKSRKLKKHTSYIVSLTEWRMVEKVLQKLHIRLEAHAGQEQVEIHADIKSLLKNGCCRKAYLRGAFLAAGSISDPEKTYHLEISYHSLHAAREVQALMRKFHLNAKIVKRKENYVAYLKEGEHIVDFLNIIGAHTALMDLENVRIIKEMRNNINRVVNCETANLEKTVNASLRQVENIRFIKEYIGFDKIPENLREIAELRLVYHEANLKELGEMLSPTLGKSGVNHRLRKLDEIAEQARDTDSKL